MSIMYIISRVLTFLKREKANDEIESEKEKKEKIKIHDYIPKFVNQDDTVIGESIALEETRIIVKNSDCFLSIPLEAIKENTENIVVAEFNREESLLLGKEWFDRKDTLKFDENGMLLRDAPSYEQRV